MDINIVLAPYHLDRAGEGTGAGPQHWLDVGLEGALRDAGHRVARVESVDIGHGCGNETGNIFAIARELAAFVRASRESGAFPLLLAGDCSNVIGAMAGLSGEAERGLVWLDAHGDAHTPDTTETGFFDGMPLAVVLGWCWPKLAATVPGHAPLAEETVAHLGGRAFDSDEQTIMSTAGIAVIDADAMRSQDGSRLTTEAVERVASAASTVHVHLDLDVIDKADGVVSEHAVTGGPSVDALEATLHSVGELGHIGSACLCSYDPSFDTDGRAAAVGLRLMRTLTAVLPVPPSEAGSRSSTI
jgi:arginase